MDWQSWQLAQGRRQMEHQPSRAIPPGLLMRRASEGLQAAGMLPIPVVGDVAGLLGDALMYAGQPETRTWKNAGLTALGALPFFPAVGKIAKPTHKVRSDVTGSAYGQTDMEFSVWNGEDPLGYATVSVYKGKPHINMIEVAPAARRQGVAAAIIDQIANEFGGYKNIEWGMLTDDGAALKAAIDKRYK